MCMSLRMCAGARVCVLLLSLTQCFPCVEGEVSSVILFWWDQIDHPYDRARELHCRAVLTPSVTTKPNINKAGTVTKRGCVFDIWFSTIFPFFQQLQSIYITTFLLSTINLLNTEAGHAPTTVALIYQIEPNKGKFHDNRWANKTLPYNHRPKLGNQSTMSPDHFFF